jgi:CRP-like cAMP-binding protein
MSSHSTNLFLHSLSSSSRDSLTKLCVEVDLPLRKSLYESDEQPTYAYFLTSGIASVVTMMEDGGSAEVGLIGREGVVGCFHLLGPARVSTQCFIQLDATALRIKFSNLMEVFQENEEVRARILEFVQDQVISLSQLAGCNRLHSNEERLARWLLMAQDRTQTDTLNFTQEFLGMMLGARRTTVTLIAGELQRSGLIEYRRGRVRILHRENLEFAACDCYQITKALYANLYSQNLHKRLGGHISSGPARTTSVEGRLKKRVPSQTLAKAKSGKSESKERDRPSKPSQPARPRTGSQKMRKARPQR